MTANRRLQTDETLGKAHPPLIVAGSGSAKVFTVNGGSTARATCAVTGTRESSKLASTSKVSKRPFGRVRLPGTGSASTARDIVPTSHGYQGPPTSPPRTDRTATRASPHSHHLLPIPPTHD